MRTSAAERRRPGTGSRWVLLDDSGASLPVDLAPDPRRPERPVVLLFLSADCFACRPFVEDLTERSSVLRAAADVAVVVASSVAAEALSVPVPVLVARPDPASGLDLALRPSMLLVPAVERVSWWAGPVPTVAAAAERIATEAQRWARQRPGGVDPAGALRPADGVGAAPLDGGVLVVGPRRDALWLDATEAPTWHAVGDPLDPVGIDGLRRRQVRLLLLRAGFLVAADTSRPPPPPAAPPRPVAAARDCCGRTDVARLSALPGTTVTVGRSVLAVHAPSGIVRDLLLDVLAPLTSAGSAPMGFALAPAADESPDWLLWRGADAVARGRPDELVPLLVVELEQVAGPAPGTVLVDGWVRRRPADGSVEVALGRRTLADELPPAPATSVALDVRTRRLVPGPLADVMGRATRHRGAVPADAPTSIGRWTSPSLDPARPAERAVALVGHMAPAPDVAADDLADIAVALAPLHARRE